MGENTVNGFLVVVTGLGDGVDLVYGTLGAEEKILTGDGVVE